MVLRFSDATQRLLRDTVQCSREVRGVLVGTEHLLLTLIKHHEGFAETLKARNVTGETVRRVIEDYYSSRLPRFGGFSPKVRRILRQAFAESLQSGDDATEPWHVAVALLEEAEGPARDILCNLGFILKEQLAEAARIRENEQIVRDFQLNLERL